MPIVNTATKTAHGLVTLVLELRCGSARGLDGAFDVNGLLDSVPVSLARSTRVARGLQDPGALLVRTVVQILLVKRIETGTPKLRLLRFCVAAETTVFALGVKTLLAVALLEMLNSVHDRNGGENVNSLPQSKKCERVGVGEG